MPTLYELPPQERARHYRRWATEAERDAEDADPKLRAVHLARASQWRLLARDTEDKRA
jgi:hypothetical protein